jgi:5-methylcytosine-specific restriction endonuclease McrA
MRLKWQVKTHRRDQRLNKLPGTLSRREWYEILRKHEYRCAYCGVLRKDLRKHKKQELEIDHIHPVTSPLCWNDECNVVPACKACNSSKADKDVVEWGKAKDTSCWHPAVLHKYEFVKALAAL